MSGKAKRMLLLLLALLCLCGCGKKKDAKEEKEYTVYYTNLEGTRLEGKSYQPVSDRFDGILSELLTEYQNPQYTDVAGAIPLGVSINGCAMGIDELVVDFNAAYLGISNIQEVLLRASLVKTLVQLPGVVRVRFTVDGQPLTDSDGREVAAMNEDTFIDTQGEGINSYHYVTLNLYFSNAAGDKVVKEVRNVFYSSNLIMEKVIVEQIIRGPINEKLLPVADPSVLIKNVQISHDICVIDLDSKFNQEPENKGVKPETTLYAFVNAICDACDVKGVQFKIDGESDVRFRGQVNLDQVFERDAEMIDASGSSEPLTEIFLDEEGSATQAKTGKEPEPEGALQETEALDAALLEPSHGADEGGDNAAAESASVSSGAAGEQAASGQAEVQNLPAGEGTGADARSGENPTEGASDKSGETNDQTTEKSDTGTANKGIAKGVGVDPALVGEQP